KRTMLLTKNLTPGMAVYTEKLIKEDDSEYREWDPKRSKLAAAILKGLSQLSLRPGNTVLYLGASTGTTVSHVSDIVGKEGFVFAVEFAPRVCRELVFLAEIRKNIAPILADANHPETYFHKVLQADFLYQDIAQKNQAEIFLKNQMLLKNGGFSILCVKSRSIDITKKPRQVFLEVRKQIEQNLTIVDSRFLDPFQKDHCMFVCKK
ncbi:MAG: fibrillarin-like rRNA/tRNA 2'-O-methyltransferase, partial [Candidatus Woesearchaeota archaeon]